MASFAVKLRLASLTLQSSKSILMAPDTTKPLMPGNPLLDRRWALRGFQLNKMAMPLVDPINREAFRADECAYLERFSLSAEEKSAVISRDWRAMVCLGGNLFFILKITAIDPTPITEIGTQQVEMEHELFRAESLGYKLHG